jgi:eukaryotic-like serine/threonine-protein kinase
MIDSRDSDAFQPGELLNNTYRIEALLGRGGTSDVYRARSEISGRLMALKVLKTEFSGNDDYLVLLTREEEIREIRHDAVVRYSENHRTQDGHVYLLMDYVEGPGLDQKLKQGPMSADDLMTVCRRVAGGLQVAHRRNIVHRDLSPDNIILRGGDPAQAVIIDFGIAKDTNPGAETIVGNEFAGKYAYAAPEQLSGNTDARSDIYSLGALLLANFRGASPDVGANPMEVVRKKGEPLDTNGLPEPFKTLIDQMTAPDPDKRIQSIDDILAFLDNPSAAQSPVDDIDPDATVIMPPPRKADPKPEPKAAPPKPAPVAEAKNSRGGLMATLLVLLLIAGGAGGYFMGAFDSLLGPKYPIAEPFSLIVEKPADAPVRAIGYVPSEEMRDNLSGVMSDQAGSAELTLATGAIPESWGDDVLAALAPLADLDEWRMVISGNRGQISGVTSDSATHERLTADFANGLPGALTGTVDIAYEPVFLSAETVRPILQNRADCGPLELGPVPAVGFGPQTPITVTGRVAETATRVGLFDALHTVAGARKIILDVEVLNPTLCLIEQNLPNAPASDIKIAYSVGDSGEPNSSGRFFVGENPVIDVVLPADVTEGYLNVSILDVSGNVFHLLPNINRQDNLVSALRAGQDGTADVRVAYSLAEAASNGRLAFRVDDSTLGKSKVIVLHSAEPLFDVMRPTSESALGFAEALKEHFEANNSSIQSLDSRILVTAKP